MLFQLHQLVARLLHTLHVDGLIYSCAMRAFNVRLIRVDHGECLVDFHQILFC